MNKAFQANINGKIYYIDEDAFELLGKYLTQLKAAFPGDEGSEIVSDIESRISELFDEMTSDGTTIITLSDVNRVIDIMGRPEQISDTPVADDEANGKTADTQTPPPYVAPVKKKLFRSESDKVLGGVLGGLGIYLGWNVTLMRVAMVIMAICTYTWPVCVAYFVAWMVIPAAKTPRQILEQRGEPVTVSNVGQTVIDQPVAGGSDSNGFFKVLGAIIMGAIGLFAGVTAFTLIVVALCILAGMASLSLAGSDTLLQNFDIYVAGAPFLEGWGAFMAMLAVAIPMIALVWAACCVLFKTPAASKTVVIIGVVAEVLIIIAATVMMNLVPDVATV